MAPKNPFRASLSDKAKKKLERIIIHEEQKAGLDAQGEQIKLTPKEIIENLIDVRFELIAGEVTNRQRLGGLNDEIVALRAEVKELRALLEARSIQDDAFRTAVTAEMGRLTRQVELMIKGIKPGGTYVPEQS